MIYFLNKEIKVLLKTNLYKKFCFFECVNKQFSTVSSQKPLKPLNILFFGTDKFATVCLKELLENRRVETMQKKVVNKVEVSNFFNSSSITILKCCLQILSALSK